MTGNPASQPAGRYWRPLLRLAGIAITCLAFYFIGAQLQQSMTALQGLTIDWPPVLLALAFGCASLTTYALLWRANLRQFGVHISATAAARIWFVSQLVRYVPGNVWHLFGRAYLARAENVPLQPLAVSLGLELFQTITAALLLAALTMPFWPIPALAQPFLLLTIPMLLAYFWTVLLNWPVGILARRSGYSGPVLQLRRVDLLTLLPGYCLSWLLYGCGVYLLAIAIYPLPLTALPAVAASFALAWVVGFLSFITPSGLGVREGMLSFLLATVMPAPEAVLVALLARVWLTLAELLVAAVAWILWRRRGALLAEKEHV